MRSVYYILESSDRLEKKQRRFTKALRAQGFVIVLISFGCIGMLGLISRLEDKVYELEKKEIEKRETAE